MGRREIRNTTGSLASRVWSSDVPRIVLRTVALRPPSAPARALSASASRTTSVVRPADSKRERSGSPLRYALRDRMVNGGAESRTGVLRRGPPEADSNPLTFGSTRKGPVPRDRPMAHRISPPTRRRGDRQQVGAGGERSVRGGSPASHPGRESLQPCEWAELPRDLSTVSHRGHPPTTPFSEVFLLRWWRGSRRASSLSCLDDSGLAVVPVTHVV